MLEIQPPHKKTEQKSYIKIVFLLTNINYVNPNVVTNYYYRISKSTNHVCSAGYYQNMYPTLVIYGYIYYIIKQTSNVLIIPRCIELCLQSTKILLLPSKCEIIFVTL